LNRVNVIGRICRETALKEIGDGRIVMNNTIAVPRLFNKDKGQDTDFLGFVAWGKRATLIEEYCEKGDLIGIDGRLQSRSYQDENQKTVYVVELVVENVHFLQTKKKAVDMLKTFVPLNN